MYGQAAHWVQNETLRKSDPGPDRNTSNCLRLCEKGLQQKDDGQRELLQHALALIQLARENTNLAQARCPLTINLATTSALDFS